MSFPKISSWAIFLLSILIYINTVSHRYALDDKAVITHNNITAKGWAGIPELFTTAYWYGMNGDNEGVYRPLSPVTFAIEQAIFGRNPYISHGINVLLYGLSMILLFRVLTLMFNSFHAKGNIVFAAIATLLFAGHPVHTEVVANIKSRDELLAFMGILLALYACFRSLQTKRWIFRIVGPLCFALALLSKEHALTFAALLPLALFFFTDRSIRSLVLDSLPYVVVAIGYLGLYFQLTSFVPADGLHVFDNALNADAPASDLWATKIFILGKYLALLVFPHPLVYDYSYDHIPITGFTDYRVWATMVVFLASLAIGIKLLISRLSGARLSFAAAVVGFSVGWFWIGISMVSNIFFLIGSTMAERFLYMPSLGFCLLLTLGIFRLTKTREEALPVARHKALWLIVFAVFLTHAGKTLTRNMAWKNDFTLFRNDIRYLPRNAKANHNLSNVYVEQAAEVSNPERAKNLYVEAKKYLERAIAIYPDVVEFHDDMGNIHGRLGDFSAAINSYQASIQINPKRAKPHAQLGKAYGFVRQYEQAVNSLEVALLLDPVFVDAYLSLGITYGMLQQYNQAIRIFEKGLEISPRHKDLLQNIIITYQQTGNTEQAAVYQQQLNSGKP